MTWSEIALFILAIDLFALGGLALVVTVQRLGEKSFRRVALPGLVAVAGRGIAVASAYTYEYLGDRHAQRSAIAEGGEEDPDAPALNRQAARLQARPKTMGLRTKLNCPRRLPMSKGRFGSWKAKPGVPGCGIGAMWVIFWAMG